MAGAIKNPSTKTATKESCMRSRLMYVEPKGVEAKGGSTEPARISLVTLVKLGRMIYHDGRALVPQSARKNRKRANYMDAHTGEPFWIAAVRKDGYDSLEPRIVCIDEEVREEYRRSVREMPDCSADKSYRSPGKQA
jgi:hypothetical protein